MSLPIRLKIWHSSEGLIISTIMIIIFVLFFKLDEIAAIGSISILFVHALVHIGHLLKTDETKASRILIIFAILTIAVAIVLALQYTSKHIPDVGYFIAAGFVLAFIIEIGLRVISKQTRNDIFHEIKEFIGEK